MTSDRRPMRIAFVLPAPVRVPQGGAAVVVRHADGLVERGHEVDVIAPQRAPGLWPRVRHQAVRLRDVAHGVAQDRPFEPRFARVVEPATLRAMDLSTYDAVIATGHQTTPWVADLTSGAGFYFLQGDERALSSAAAASWHLPLVRVAVASWLAALVQEHGETVAGVVPNAVDPDEMGCDVAPEARPARVMALYHRHPVKDPATLIRTLSTLRETLPDVQATVVSARLPSHRLPDWVDVQIRPTRTALRAIYNRSAVCLHTSVVEGWGLVPMEAAACGCAVVATASRGPREFLTSGRSMVEVPVGDANGLAREASRLLRDSAARASMARAGVDDVARFSWAESTETLERILLAHTA